MPDVKILPGIDGVALSTATFTSTAQTLERTLASDFVLLLQKFKADLLIDDAYPRVLPEIAVSKSVEIEVTSAEAERGKPFRTIVVRFYIEKSATADNKDLLALKTATLIRDMLLANNNFDHQIGLLALNAVSIVAGQDYIPLREPEEGDQLDGAQLTATYSAVNLRFEQ